MMFLKDEKSVGCANAEMVTEPEAKPSRLFFAHVAAEVKKVEAENDGKTAPVVVAVLLARNKGAVGVVATSACPGHLPVSLKKLCIAAAMPCASGWALPSLA